MFAYQTGNSSFSDEVFRKTFSKQFNPAVRFNDLIMIDKKIKTPMSYKTWIQN